MESTRRWHPDTLMPLLLKTVAQQAAQLEREQQAREADRKWQGDLDVKLAEILGLLKSMAHINTLTDSGAAAKPLDTGDQLPADKEGARPEPLVPESNSILPSDLPDGCLNHYFLSHCKQL